MALDVAAMRRNFPVFAHQPPPFHYLDNAATGQICAAAAEALRTFETAGRANVKRGVYRLADRATQAFAEARERMAAYLGATRPEEVILTSGTTFGLNLAAHVLEARVGPDDAILVSRLEHHSNIVPWQMLAERRGARIRALGVTEEGRLDLRDLEAAIDRRTRIVAVTHCSNVTGAVTDLAPLVARARAVGALVVVDGAQRVPHGPLEVASLGCDIYALSAHKMFGATGAGALWIRHDLLETLPPFLGGGEMISRVTIEESRYAPPPHRFEAGTPPIGPVLAMGAAADWLAGLDWQAILAHEKRLTARLIAGLEALPGLRLIGPRDLDDRYGVVAFEVAGVHAHDVCQLLDGFGVCTRGGHHCAQPLMDAFGTVATVRASLAPYNDADDIDALLEGLEQVIRILR